MTIEVSIHRVENQIKTFGICRFDWFAFKLSFERCAGTFVRPMRFF